MLSAESERLDISISDLLRRIIDKHFEHQGMQTIQHHYYPENYFELRFASGNTNQ